MENPQVVVDVLAARPMWARPQMLAYQLERRPPKQRVGVGPVHVLPADDPGRDGLGLREVLAPEVELVTVGRDLEGREPGREVWHERRVVLEDQEPLDAAGPSVVDHVLVRPIASPRAGRRPPVLRRRLGGAVDRREGSRARERQLGREPLIKGGQPVGPAGERDHDDGVEHSAASTSARQAAYPARSTGVSALFAAP